jgi:hypothetical protein
MTFEQTYPKNYDVVDVTTWCQDFHVQWGVRLDTEIGAYLNRPSFGQPLFEDILNQELLDNVSSF